MILVTTGTNSPAFDRLLREVERLGLDERVVVQHGPSAIRPAGAECVDYISFDRFVELVREARVVVTHAGVGSILVTLMNGKRPVVVPRRADLGEHVDDHQLELARKLDDEGLVTLVEDPTRLPELVRSRERFDAPSGSITPSPLVAELRGYLMAHTVNRGPLDAQ